MEGRDGSSRETRGFVNLEIRENIQLGSWTSWQIGGGADFFCTPKTIEELREAQLWAQQNQKVVTILGGGSNVLISDAGIRGLTICLKYLAKTHVEVLKNTEERFFVRALSGTSKSELLKIFLKARLAPALFLAGLPGDVGGGIVMNAGVAEAFEPREFVEMIDWVDVLKPDGQIQRYEKADLQWSYRHCHGWQPGIIVEAGMSWKNEPDPQVIDKVKEANKVRLSKQPLDMPSCGSVFQNPEGAKAAQLIDRCGLKGLRQGEAQVSLKHANFIVNLGNAKAMDTWNLILQIQEKVHAMTGISLKTEVVRLGEWA